MQLSIIIVNYNVKYFLEQCLLSVIKACKSISAEIIVVDNHSTDGSREFFKGRFPQVQFLWQNENAGFAKANNKALELARGETILFLNPDTIIPEDCLEKCLAFLTQHQHTGALGVKMIDGSGRYLPESKRGFPTALTSFCKITGLTKLFPGSSIASRYYMGHLPKDRNATIDVVAGAFMMVDRKLLEKLGGFDEDYFMYAEDIDLSYRIQKEGYQNIYFADTVIIHFKGESTAKQSAEYVRNFYGAMILFVQKHYSKLPGIFFTLLLKLLIQVKLLTISKQKADYKDGGFDNSIMSLFCSESKFNKLSLALKNHHVSTERISSIKELKYGTSAICFCEEFISFEEVIHNMQHLAGKCSFFINADNARSLVGSTDKNKTGMVISLD